MTKPSYEERKCPHCAGSLTRYEDPLAVKEIARLDAELARVRGLLQRATEALLSCQKSANTNPLTNGICVACGAAYDHYTNCVLLSKGAESADIGKLDRADEVGDYSCAVCGFGMMEPCEHWKRMVGSAETGGEKAAPSKRDLPAEVAEQIKNELIEAEYLHPAYELDVSALILAAIERNFCSQFESMNNVACSCGHDGDEHWQREENGQLADCSKCKCMKFAPGPESREPEKLNNAQPEYRGLFASMRLGDIMVTGTEEAVKWAIAALSSAYRLGRNERLAATHKSLAESSLSQNADSSAPTIPEPRSTQPDTATEKK